MSTAPQGWQNPKTNWQAADIVHPSDFNRIEGNAQAIELGSRTVDQSLTPSGNSGTLRQFLSWFANRLKAITGASNWYNTPPTTLQAAKTHMNAAAPHSGHATTTALNNHVNDKDNPHRVTAAQVNLSPGVILAYGGNTVPDGWKECNGQALSRTTYSKLFSVIGTTYGAGDGKTTFNVPDLRGEFIRGWDHGRGVDSGRAFGSWQADELKSHTHNYVGVQWHDRIQASSKEMERGGTDLTKTTTATGGPETRPRNIAMMYIIKT